MVDNSSHPLSSMANMRPSSICQVDNCVIVEKYIEKEDKKTVENVFKNSPVGKVPLTGGTKMRIRQKKKPHKK